MSFQLGPQNVNPAINTLTTPTTLAIASPILFSAAWSGVIQRLLGAYYAANPEVIVQLSERESPEQVRQLLEGSLDAGIARNATVDPGKCARVQSACRRSFATNSELRQSTHRDTLADYAHIRENMVLSAH